MKDMQIIGSIIVFMVFQVLAFGFISADPFFQSLGTSGNTTLTIDANTDNFNMTDVNPTAVTTSAPGLIQFLDSTKRFFTIRINVLDAFPAIVKTLIGFINFFLVVMLGIVMWRQIKVGGGG